MKRIQHQCFVAHNDEKARRDHKTNGALGQEELTEEEEVAALGLSVGEEGGVLGQKALRAGLVVLALVVGRVAVDVDCERKTQRQVSTS